MFPQNLLKLKSAVENSLVSLYNYDINFIIQTGGFLWTYIILGSS